MARLPYSLLFQRDQSWSLVLYVRTYFGSRTMEYAGEGGELVGATTPETAARSGLPHAAAYLAVQLRGLSTDTMCLKRRYCETA